MGKSQIEEDSLSYFFLFLRDLVVYVCMETQNTKMTNLTVNYLVY